MKAARRSGDVNVSYSSAAVVRNSSFEVTVVVLTDVPLSVREDFEEDVALALA